MTSRWSLAPGARYPVQHGLGFLFSGTLAFLADASILKLLTAVFDLHPIVARLIAISGFRVFVCTSQITNSGAERKWFRCGQRRSRFSPTWWRMPAVW